MEYSLAFSKSAIKWTIILFISRKEQELLFPIPVYQGCWWRLKGYFPRKLRAMKWLNKLFDLQEFWRQWNVRVFPLIGVTFSPSCFPFPQIRRWHEKWRDQEMLFMSYNNFHREIWANWRMMWWVTNCFVLYGWSTKERECPTVLVQISTITLA